jgi:hypothetical protein
MPQSLLLKAGGLYTFPNSLSEIPTGALTRADNAIIDRNGIIESRRGFPQYGNTFGIGTDRAKQLMQYKNRLLRHFDSTIQFDNGTGTFTSFAGSYNETETGLRMKFIEENGNFYFTTAAGIFRISASTAAEFTAASGYIRPAGGVQALDVNGVVDYSSGGWFIYQTDVPGQTKVAYRVTWGFYDANNNFVEGAPSSRLVLTNYSTTDSANVNLTFEIPSQISTTDTQFFYRIYRTGVVQTSIGVTLDNLDPGDEQYLVIQDFPTSAQLTARTVDVTDITPEAFRRNGSLLYTNPVSGEGILQSNYAPPIAKDINLFQNTVFYANTQTIQQLNLALLSVDDFISGTSTITITQGLNNNIYTFVGTKQVQKFTFDTQANTTDGSYFLINAASDVRKYFVWFAKSGSYEITNFTFDNFANTTDGSYFLLNSSNDERQYFVWFDKTGSTAAPNGLDTVNKVGIRVPLTTGFTADQVTTAVANALPVGDFGTAINTNILTVTNTIQGATTDATAGIVPPGGAFAITLITQGADPTTQPSGLDTIGRLPVYVDITQAITADDVAAAVTTALLDIVDFVSVQLMADVTVTNADNGECDAAIAGAVPPGGAFAITVLTSGTGEDTSIQQVLLGGSVSPAISIDETARSLVKNINANPMSIVDAFYQSGPTDLPGLILLQARNLSEGSFSVTANSTATGDEFSPALPISGTSVSSENLVELNAIYYSKFQQPEAVPAVNKFLVGPKDKAILRVLPLRTGLMILKEDGIYRLTGTNGQFNIDPFDNSAICLAADSAQILNNQIYMFSTQGVVTLTDTGVSVISRPIEDQLERVTTPAFNFKPNTFGVTYESDRAYMLWTVTNTNDTVPTQCFRFNTFTTAWTRWPISKTCGIVKFDEQRLYLGPGDANFIERERKNLDRTDYADREFSLQIPVSPIVSDHRVKLSSTSDVDAGDVLVQTQYLTIYQFNRLLKMLDYDPNVGYNDYFDTLGASSGTNLRNGLDDLANKLDTDPNLFESDFFSSMTHGTTFTDLQTDHNILVGLLNLNVNPVFKNYPTSIGSIVLDMVITAPIQNSNDVLVLHLSPIIEGPITLSKGIRVEVIWAPQTFGDPSISKHVSEGTFLFDNTTFSSAIISYASDLMAGFEDVAFEESGIGDWGGFVWDEQTWGGQGTSVPMRTYIPRNKQYCRFLRPRFIHMVSREKFSLLGASLTFRPLTERAYRS